MESLQHLKGRLQAVKNISQITKAMEVVSATKMRRAQEYALNSRPYAYKALEILAEAALHAPIETTLTVKRPVKKTVAVVVSSDRGLVGAFNTQLVRAIDSFFAKDEYANNPKHSYGIVAVGKKSAAYATKKGYELIESFSGFGDYAEAEEIVPLADMLIDGFEKGKWDRVVVLSTHFLTTLRQEVRQRQLLPVEVERIDETVREIIPEHGRYAELANKETGGKKQETRDSEKYIFEPTPQETLQLLVPHLVRMQMYHLMLEANASEHSARRVAMKTATDNANELSQNLLIEYNKTRQAGITKEIIEITSTQAALQ